ncbi:unnamed protein product [Lathyrus sativus]|nr:unnamed protein product [Lathyrus sativus]
MAWKKRQFKRESEEYVPKRNFDAMALRNRHRRKLHRYINSFTNMR